MSRALGNNINVDLSCAVDKLDRDAILGMSAGIELDALVAEKIMGWKWIDYRWWNGDIKRLLTHDKITPFGDDFNRLNGAKNKLLYWDMPSYSTDISAAWEVVEIFKTEFVIDYLADETLIPIGWHCNIKFNHVYGCKTAQEAICKGALIATIESL